MLTARQEEILNAIIDVFTQTHEPVSSKALQTSIQTSSATIRNEMSALEKLGLLEKAHTSSGRRPSIQGFKYFVEHSLTFDQISEQDVYQVVKAFDFEFFKLDDLLQCAAQILSDLTGQTVLIQDAEPSHQKLTAFDLAPVSHHVVLAVLTLDEANTLTSQFTLPRHLLPSDLATIKQLVTDRLLGKTVLDIHYQIRTVIPQLIQRYFTTTDHIMDLFEHIFKDMYAETVRLAGKVHLLKHADLTTYQHFDQPQQLAVEVRANLSETEMLRVQVAESVIPQLSQMTVISQKFLVPYRGFGILTLIGPVDLPYARVAGLLNLVTRILMMKLTDFYRYLASNHYEVH